MTVYRKIENKCAECEGIQDQPLEQAQQVPEGWGMVVVSERLAAIARTPQEAVGEQVRFRNVVFPVCSDGCGAKLLMKRALGMTRTKAEREELNTEFQEVIDGG